MIQAVLISQGNELTTGQTVDSNAAWLAQRLWDLGIEVRRVMTSPDSIDEISSVLALARELAPVVICTGGLGPTRDDLTAEALAGVLDRPLVENSEALAQIEAIFARFKREMAPNNRKQAQIPDGLSVLPNSCGTAPGIAEEGESRLLCCLPGVPHEMKAMFDSEVEPRLRMLLKEAPPVRHIVRVLGLPESVLEQRLEGLTLPGLEIGFRAGVPSHEVKLRFSARVPSSERIEIVNEARRRLGPRAFGVDCGDLAQVVGQLLAEREETLSLAESCTAGQLAAWVASIPGASAWFLEGTVVYSNAAKTRCCSVRPELIEEFGSVSEPVALAMADGVRNRSGSNWAVGITGLAGPSGARPGKPTGTVHISVIGPDTRWHRRYQFHGNRSQVTRRSVAEAMYRLYRAISDEIIEP
jgi:nicotinamide-nucleotide amidase